MVDVVPGPEIYGDGIAELVVLECVRVRVAIDDQCRNRLAVVVNVCVRMSFCSSAWSVALLLFDLRCFYLHFIPWELI